jgi:hypothetical protein
MFQTKVLENIKIRVSCPLTLFIPKKQAVYETMRKHMAEPVGTQMTLQ